jgi:hypothetical protein
VAEAPYQRDWRPVGDRHGLQIGHATSEAELEGPDGTLVPARVATFSVLAEDGALVLRHDVPYALAADWVAALIAVLDVPAGRLPPPTEWGAQAEALARHRMQLAALPGTDGPG